VQDLLTSGERDPLAEEAGSAYPNGLESEPSDGTNNLTGDPSRVLTCQKGDKTSCILGLSHSPHGKAGQEIPFHFLGHPPGIGRTRIDRIDRDPAWSDFHRQGAGECLNGSFGRGIG
jgi:hypothetical protein